MTSFRQRATVATLMIAAASVIIQTACDDGPGPEQNFSCAYVTDFPGALLVGDTVRVMEVQDENGVIVPGSVFEWSSSAPSVATVDSTGLVMGRLPGTATISANACSVTIEVAPRPASVELVPDTLRIVPGNRGLIGVLFRDAAGRVLDHWALPLLSSWRSSDYEVTTPTYYGGDPGPQVPGQAEGVAAVSVRLRDLSATMTVAVARVTLRSPDVGAVHSCARSSDGSPYCWGSIQFLILPYGPGAVWGPAPAVVAAPLRFASLASGADHLCGITADDALYCMGVNEAGQVGVGVDGPVVGPRRVQPETGFRAVTAGWGHTCALTTDGQLFCWGLNDVGQLGAATPGGECRIYVPKGESMTVPCSRVPVPAAPGFAFGSVGAGNGLTCGLTTAGDLHCWGRLYGPEPVLVGDGLGLVSFDLGGGGGGFEVPRSLACGLDAAGAAYCWGTNPGGLGDGSTTESTTPVPVAGGLTFRALSVGDVACGLTVAGPIYCWGGSFSFAASHLPVPVPGGIAFETVSVGLRHACGTAVDGRVYCWGSNDRGQLGAVGVAGSLTPILLTGQR